MDVHDFFLKLKQHCSEINGKCEQCCFNDFCYTSPKSITDAKLNQTLQMLGTTPKVVD